MLKVKLIENKGELVIVEYKLTYPFNLINDNDNQVYYNVNSSEYKNIKGSFHLFFCKKFDFSELTVNGEKKNIKNGKITNIDNLHSTGIDKQYLLFSQRLLFFLNEKNSFSQTKKKKIPHFLLINEEEAKRNIQFFISYEETSGVKKIKNEEIIFYLNLFRDD